MTWTKQPPKERGYYWYREPERSLLVVDGPDEWERWYLIGDAEIGKSGLMKETGEWWDQRIPEPPEKAEHAPEDWGHEDCEVCNEARRRK